MVIDSSNEKNTDLLPPALPKDKRPWLITWVCILGFFYLLLVFYVLMMLNRERTILLNLYGWEFFIFILISHLLILISLMAIWSMKYWGAFLLTATIVFSAIYSYAVKIPTARWEFVPSLVILFVCFIYRKQMKY